MKSEFDQHDWHERGTNHPSQEKCCFQVCNLLGADLRGILPSFFSQILDFIYSERFWFLFRSILNGMTLKTSNIKLHHVWEIVRGHNRLLIRRRRPQYERQSKLNCPTETTRKQPFSSQLTKRKTMLKLLWPLLVVNLRIPGLIWSGTYFVQNNTTIIPPFDTRRTRGEFPGQTQATHFLTLEAWRHRMFHNFHLLQWFGICKFLTVNI